MMSPKQIRRRAPPKTKKLAASEAAPKAALGKVVKQATVRKVVKQVVRPKAVEKTARPTPAPRSDAGASLLVDPRAPKPFVKWAGGKRQLLDEIRERLPDDFKTYHEPFVGGGAVFFALSAGRPAHLSDSNLRLVRAYRGIKESVADVIGLLQSCQKSRDAYLKMRARDIDAASDAEVAAWFIYLNKLGFNGLYRVNSKNKFNVPYGDNDNAVICDERNLRACAEALVRAELHCEDFTSVRDRARPGDVVYFDPPYFPVSSTSYFTSYTVGGFTRADQEKLRDLARDLKEAGVHVLLSNSPPAADLYRADLGFSVTEVLASRAVNSKAELRGKITELLIT
jgi:DNA adenine methylase